jgi:hypothetical protein
LLVEHILLLSIATVCDYELLVLVVHVTRIIYSPLIFLINSPKVRIVGHLKRLAVRSEPNPGLLHWGSPRRIPTLRGLVRRRYLVHHLPYDLVVIVLGNLAVLLRLGVELSLTVEAFPVDVPYVSIPLCVLVRPPKW